MSERKESLEALLAKVKAGEALGFDPVFEFAFYVGGNDMVTKVRQAEQSYNGSLDAAKALHDAVLPGWDVEIDTRGGADVAVIDPADPDGLTWHVGKSQESIARAWLIAIINALIAATDTEVT